MLKLPLKLINRFFNILGNKTLINIVPYDYGASSLISVCLVRLSIEHGGFVNGLYLYIIDIFNCLPIYKYYIGNRESEGIIGFNTNGVIINFNDFSNYHISLEVFHRCLYIHNHLQYKDKYERYVETVINTYLQLSLLSKAEYNAKEKPFSSNQERHTPKLYQMCNELLNNLKYMEDNYLIEFMEGV